jgi:hypothetical protein
MNTTNEALSIILLVICLGLMPLVLLHNIKNHINLYQQRKFLNSSGNLYEDIDLRTKWAAAFYLMFIIRRIVFVSIVFSIEQLSAI